MRIHSVQAHLLSYLLPDPLRVTFHGGEQTIVKRDAMLIRIQADNRMIGYAPGPGTESAKDAIDNVIAPFLVGRTLADPDALRVQFLEETGRDPALQRVYCALEIGLYDLIGKEQGPPRLGAIGRTDARSYSALCQRRPAYDAGKACRRGVRYLSTRVSRL